MEDDPDDFIFSIVLVQTDNIFSKPLDSLDSPPRPMLNKFT